MGEKKAAEAVVVYSNRYLFMAEMVAGILKEEGVGVVVRARDPFGAFGSGPHLTRFQPTPCSTYEVLVPADQRLKALELIEGFVE